MGDIDSSSFPAKNVAADIADKLCESVSTRLVGKVLGTFSSESLHYMNLLFLSLIL